MFPITSFTASLGHDGNIDIFALALSPQAQPGRGVPVFRIRQKKAGGEWQPWAPAGKPGQRGARNAGGQPVELTAQRSRNSAPHCTSLLDAVSESRSRGLHLHHATPRPVWPRAALSFGIFSSSGFLVRALHFILHALGQLFNLLRLLDHVHRQDVGTGAIDILFEFSGQAEELFGVAAKRQLPFAKSIGDLRTLKLLGKIDSRVDDRNGLNLRATSHSFY